MRKIIFDRGQSPGDILAFTPVIRDFKLSHPNILIDVATCCPEIFSNNPYLTKMGSYDFPEKYSIGYTKGVQKSSFSGEHFTQAYYREVEEATNLKIKKTSFIPELFLTEDEKNFSLVQKKFNLPNKYWVINAGHKSCFPLKQWGFKKWELLLRYLTDAHLNIVQIGAKSEIGDNTHHTHPELYRAHSLVGKTSLRELIIIAYHSQGAICHVTFLMHVMAAFNKPCVVIAGGREPKRWEMYHNHRYLDTIGYMKCCYDKGCWRSGTIGYDNGKIYNSLCFNYGEEGGACMDLISEHTVLSSVLGYYNGGVLE